MKINTLTIAVLTALTVNAIADVSIDDYPFVKEFRETFATNETAITAEMKADYFTNAVQFIDAVREDGGDWKQYMQNPNLVNFGTAEEWADLDTRWADAGVDLFAVIYFKKLPKVTSMAFEVDGNKGQFRRDNFYVTFCAMTNMVAEGKNSLGAPARINILVAKMVGGVLTTDKVSAEIQSICKAVIPDIRTALRKQGKSFIMTEEGINPVQDKIDALTTALQAPRCDGVLTWVAEIYPDYVWIQHRVTELTDEEVQELKDKVYYGQIELSNHRSAQLLYYLGLDAYNAFIEQYNQ